MPLPTVVGTYIAGIKSRKLDEYNGGPILDVLFQLRQFSDPEQGWTPVVGDLEITKRFFLKKNDGTWSEHTLNALKESLDWDGTIKGLVNADWSASEVQVVVGHTERNGKQYIGVDFMNPRDYAGKNLSTDPTVVQSLEAKYGALLRQATGGKVNGRPAPKPAAPAKQILAPKTPEEAKRVAWAEFKGKTANLSDDDRKASFIETVNQYGNGKAVASLTMNDWENITNQIAEFGPYKKPEPKVEEAPELETVPADTSETIKDEDIPF